MSISECKALSNFWKLPCINQMCSSHYGSDIFMGMYLHRKYTNSSVLLGAPSGQCCSCLPFSSLILASLYWRNSINDIVRDFSEMELPCKGRVKLMVVLKWFYPWGAFRCQGISEPGSDIESEFLKPVKVCRLFSPLWVQTKLR